MEERELAGGPTHNCPIKKRLQGFGTTSWVSTTTDTGIWKPEILYCDQIQPIEKKIHAIAIPASPPPVSVTRNIRVVDMVIRPIVNPLDFNVKWHPWCERIYLWVSAKENDRKPDFVLLYVSWTLDFVTWMLFVVHVDDG